MNPNIRYERERVENLALSEECKIIWHASELVTYYDQPTNSVCQFRKEFTLDQESIRADVYLFADTHYIFYVNGTEILRGPCRSDPRWQYVDKINIAPYLKEGKNVISAMVMYYGYGTGKSISRIPAFLLDCNIVLQNESVVQIVSDESFKVNLPNMFDRTAPRTNGCKGVIEVLDNRESFPFYEMDFDDSQWENAKARDKYMAPFWNYKERPVPYIKLAPVTARAAVSGGMGDAVKEGRLNERIKKEVESVKPNTLFVLGSEGEINPTETDQFSYVIVDFEKVRAGYLTLDVTGYDGDIIDVVYAEELFHNKPKFDGTSYRPISRFILKDGENHLQTHFNYEAFRYVMLIFRNHVRKNNILSIGMLERKQEVEHKSEFYTNDADMQKILDISMHTLDLCMQDGFLDSPSREQQQWMGDGRFQAEINYYVTGDCRLHEKLLLQIAQSQDIEGMTCSRYPDGNHNLPPIPSFCLQWINSFGDYYDFTGKTALIEKLWNQILLGIRWFSAFENEYCLLTDVPYWNYLDVSKNEKGEHSDIFRGGMIGQLNLMYIEGLETVSRLADLFNDKETGRYFRTKCRKAKQNFRKLFWNGEKGAYCDCVVQGEQSQSVSEAVNALALLLLHQKGQAKAEAILKNVFCDETKMERVCVVSPYFMVPFYRAMQKMGRTDIALFETKRRYKDMIDMGASTTWEHWALFEPRPNGEIFMHSACHAWAAAPVLFFVEQILGIDARKTNGMDKNIKPTEDVKATVYTYRSKYKLENGKIKEEKYGTR